MIGQQKYVNQSSLKTRNQALYQNNQPNPGALTNIQNLAGSSGMANGLINQNYLTADFKTQIMQANINRGQSLGLHQKNTSQYNGLALDQRSFSKDSYPQKISNRVDSSKQKTGGRKSQLSGMSGVSGNTTAANGTTGNTGALHKSTTQGLVVNQQHTQVKGVRSNMRQYSNGGLAQQQIQQKRERILSGNSKTNQNVI